MPPKPPPTNEETHLRLLKAVEDRPDATQRQLAAVLGMSLGKTHYCLRALVDKGWIKARNFRASRHKVGYMMLLTPQGIEAKARLTLNFLHWKLAEYELLRAEIEMLTREAAIGDAFPKSQ